MNCSSCLCVCIYVMYRVVLCKRILILDKWESSPVLSVNVCIISVLTKVLHRLLYRLLNYIGHMWSNLILRKLYLSIRTWHFTAVKWRFGCCRS